MSLSKPTRRRNGQTMITVRAVHHVGGTEIVQILCRVVSTFGDDCLVSKKAAEQALREQLYSRGADAADQLDEELEPGTIEMVRERASTFWPDLFHN